MFSDGDMLEVKSTHSNDDVWDDNNILRCKQSPKRSLKEQACDLAPTLTVGKCKEKVITIMDLPSDMCPIRLALVASLAESKNDGELNLPVRKEKVIKDNGGVVEKTNGNNANDCDVRIQEVMGDVEGLPTRKWHIACGMRLY